MRNGVETKGPPKQFLLGHWRRFEQDRLAFLRECYQVYGDTTHLDIVFPTLLIHNPADIQHVLITREQDYRKSLRVIHRVGRRLFGEGLLTRSGTQHRRQRRLVQPGFQQHAISTLHAAIQTHLDRMLEDWRKRPEVDLTEEMDRFAERVLIQAVLGPLDEVLMQRISQANRARRRFINHAFQTQFPFPELLPTRLNLQYQQAVRAQRSMLRKLVQTARAGSPASAGEPSLLARMAAAQTSDGDRLSEEDLLQEVWELMTAGYETSREALIWAVYLLAKHPDEAAVLRTEVERWVDRKAVPVDSLPHLVSTEMFFSEALRLFPPSWMFVRVASRSGILPSGVSVRAGTKIFLCPYTAHRNPAFFPDPERFDPSRFTAEARRSRPKFAYFPFGGGPRVCVAESLARLEGVMMLAAVAATFDLKLRPGQQVEPVGAITLRPRNPIHLEVQPATTHQQSSGSLRHIPSLNE